MRFHTSLALVCAVTLLIVAGCAQQPAAQPEPSPATGFADALSRAQTAFAAGDWAAVRDALTAAETFAPTHPIVLYHLARAEAFTGSADGALRRLQRLADAGGTERDIAGDTAFALLRGRADFQAVVERLRAAAAPVVRSDTAFVLADPDFIPEGIAYDPETDAFFLGSLHRGQILRVTRDGTADVFAPNAADATNGRRGQVVGMRVDPARRVLWAATLVVDTAAPPFERGPGGWASLRAFDLNSGRLLASHSPPDPTSPHLLNDIALAPNGDVYVSDSEGSALYRLPNGGAALELVYGGSPQFGYPNGVAADSSRGRIYVAHMEGISTLGLRNRQPARPTPLVTQTGRPMSGIDGLYYCGGGLLGIQSLLDSQQVVRFVLGADGVTVTEVKVLERKHPAHNAATTGTIAGDTLFYIASSQLGRLQPDGSVRAAEGPPTSSVILRLPLDGACAG